MARVLVAHADEAVRDAIAAALMNAAGHTVVATSDGVQSLAALWLSEGPLIALIDERLLPFSAVDIFRIVANDKPEGELGRHRYVLLSTWPGQASMQWRGLLTRLDIPVLALPFELDRLVQVVDDLSLRRGAGGRRPLLRLVR